MLPQELSVKTKRINEQSKCSPQALLGNKRYKTIITCDIQMNPKTTHECEYLGAWIHRVYVHTLTNSLHDASCLCWTQNLVCRLSFVLKSFSCFSVFFQPSVPFLFFVSCIFLMPHNSQLHRVPLSVCSKGLWPPYLHCAVCSFAETHNENLSLFPLQKSWPLA